MNVHFIAIGGAAMHNLALALYNKGMKVTRQDNTRIINLLHTDFTSK